VATSSLPDLIAEGGPNPTSPTMEQNPLVGIADPEHRADLGGVEALHITEEHDLTLCEWKLVQTCPGSRRKLLCPLAIFSFFGPRLWCRCPCTTDVEFLEGFVVHVGIHGTPMAALALAGALGSVDQDREEPRRDARAPLEAIKATNDSEPRVLDNFLSQALGRNEPSGQAQHPRLVRPHQRFERRLVAGAEAFE
jgi:hypothetical protein